MKCEPCRADFPLKVKTLTKAAGYRLGIETVAQIQPKNINPLALAITRSGLNALLNMMWYTMAVGHNAPVLSESDNHQEEIGLGGKK